MNIGYKDKLVEITDSELVLHWYFFPFCTKRVPLREIEYVQVKESSLTNGAYRAWGTGGGAWFPLDWKRSTRDAIFFVVRRNRRLNIGFTAEDSQAIKLAFTKRGLLR